jgi:hypothetical protein
MRLTKDNDVTHSIVTCVMRIVNKNDLDANRSKYLQLSDSFLVGYKAFALDNHAILRPYHPRKRS